MSYATIKALMDRAKEFPDRLEFQRQLVGEVVMSGDVEALPDPFQNAIDSSEYPDMAGEVWDRAHNPEPEPSAHIKPEDIFTYEVNLSGEVVKVSATSREEFITLFSAKFRERWLMKQTLPQELVTMKPEAYGVCAGRIWDKAHTTTASSTMMVGAGAATEQIGPNGFNANEVRKKADNG